MVEHELHIIISTTCAQAAEEGSGVGYVRDRAVSQRHALGLWRDDRLEGERHFFLSIETPGHRLRGKRGSFFPTKQKYKIYTDHLRYYNSNNR